jgi:replication factor A1
MASARLTPNGVPAGLAGDLNLRPVLQVVNLRCVNVDGPGAARPDRWRGLVSDGTETCPAMFAGQLSNLARSGVLRRGTVAQLDEYVVNVVGGRRFATTSPLAVVQIDCFAFAVRAVQVRVPARARAARVLAGIPWSRSVSRFVWRAC